MAANFDLTGRVALVTGASYGIGLAIAKGFAGAGATIVFNDIKEELVQRGLASYKEAGIEAHGYVQKIFVQERHSAFHSPCCEGFIGTEAVIEVELA